MDIDEEPCFELDNPPTMTRMCREKNAFEDLLHSDNVFRATRNSMLQTKRRRGRGARFGRSLRGGGRQRNTHDIHELETSFQTSRPEKVLAAILADAPTGSFKTFKATVSQDMVYRIVSDNDSAPDQHKALSATDAGVDTSGIADSGANINVTNQKIAAYYDLDLKLWEKPFQISFGNNSKFRCTHYADFGPILGRVAIVDDAPDTLISVAVLTSRGFQVNFMPNGQGIGIYFNNQLIYRGDQDNRSRLFTIDIGSLIQPTFQLSYNSDCSNHWANSDAKGFVVKKKPLSVQTIKEVLWLHKRMGHPSKATMIESMLNGTWTGLSDDITPRSVHTVMSKIHCTACSLSKMHKRYINEGSQIHGSYPGEEISVDYQGKISPVSVRGHTGFYLFKDRYSGYRHAVMVKDKTSKTYLLALQLVIHFYNQYGYSVRIIRCDAGSTEADSEVIRVLNKDHLVHVDPAAIEHQNQNPVEREAQTLIRGVGCLMVDQQALSSKWWCYAVQSWIQTANCRPNSNALIEGSSSAEEIVTGVTPDIDVKFRFPFGCPVSSIRTGTKEQKYQTIGEFGIAVGSTDGSNGATQILIPKRGVKSYERYDVELLKVPSLQANEVIPNVEQYMPEFTDEHGVIFKSPVNLKDDYMDKSTPLGTLGFEEFNSKMVPLRLTSAQDNSNHIRRSGMITRSHINQNAALAASVKINPNPRLQRLSTNPTLSQARKGTDWPEWNQAIQKEISMLNDLGCFEWILQSEIPPRKQILNSKMDLRTKVDSHGIKIKCKARLVALGNQEWESIRDTYAPTVNAKTINMLLALATQTGMILYGLDIFGAFITADIDEPVYMRLPENLAPKDSEGNTPIWKLKKTLYGLSRAPKAFYDDLSKYLLQNGYERCPVDPCLYKKTESETRQIFFAIHVDDFAVAATHQDLIDDLCCTLKSKYTITETDNLESFLGIHIKRYGTNLYLSQPGHIQRIVAEAKINTDHKDVWTPMSTDFNDADQNTSPPLSSDMKKNYYKLLGMLLYVLRTRPDVSYSINRLATRTAIATEMDYKCLQRVAAYLHTTSDKELVYCCEDTHQVKTFARLYAWSDAAFLTHSDSKSHSGTCFSLGESSGSFYSRSTKQSMVTLSSTESELYSAVEATKDIQYFRALLKWAGFEQLEPTPLFVDNKSLIVLAQQFSGNHKRVRHFLARINYMIEQVELHTVKLVHLAGTELKADLLTKPLPRHSFEQHMGNLLGPQRR